MYPYYVQVNGMGSLIFLLGAVLLYVNIRLKPEMTLKPESCGI